MSEGKGSSGAIEEAVINLRYKLLNEAAYKRFDAALASLSGKKNLTKTISVGVKVDGRGLRRLATLKRRLDSIAKHIRVSVGVSAPRNAAKNITSRPASTSQPASTQTSVRQRMPGKVDEFVGPPKPIPISWPSRQTSSSPQAAAQKRTDIAPTTIITVEQLKRLGDAAKAAAESIKNNSSRAIGRLGGSREFNSFNYSARDMRNRLDPRGVDINNDVAHMNRDFSSLRFGRVAPDMAGMSFSPTASTAARIASQANASSRRSIRPPDVTAFKAAVERLKEWSTRAGKELEKKLSPTPVVHTEKLKAGLNDAMAQLGVGAFAAGIAGTFDEAQHLEDQIRALTPSIKEAAEAQKGLFEASKDTNSSYKTAVDIYSALAVMKDKTKLDSSQAVEVVKSLQAASQIGGGSAAGQERAIQQVEKAIAMNKLSVIGLNSIERQSRGITVALAEGMGVTVADLRKLAHEGKIGAEEMSQALLKMAPEMQKRLGNVRVTLGNLKNYARTVMLEWATRLSDSWDGWGKGMATVRNAMSSLNDFMIRAFDKLSSVMGSSENAARLVQYAFIALGGGAVIAAVSAFGGAVLAALLPVMVAAGAVLVAILAIDDIMMWVAGKNSVMGELVGPFKNFKPVFDGIAQSFRGLGSAWSSLWNGGMGDALNKEEAEPPLARSFREVLEAVNETVKSLEKMLRMLKALKDGDYGSALDIGGGFLQNELTPGGNAKGLSWGETAKYYMYGQDPRNDPVMGWYWRSTDWIQGIRTPSLQERQQQIAQAQQSSQQTVNNSPVINITAQTNDPDAIGRSAADEVTRALNIPMLPTSERGPR